MIDYDFSSWPWGNWPWGSRDQDRDWLTQAMRYRPTEAGTVRSHP